MARKTVISTICAAALLLLIIFASGIRNSDRQEPRDPLTDAARELVTASAAVRPEETTLPEEPTPEETPPPETEEPEEEPEETPEEPEPEPLPSAEPEPEAGETETPGEAVGEGEGETDGEVQGGEDHRGTVPTEAEDDPDPILPPEPTPPSEPEDLPLRIGTDLRTQTITAGEGDGETYPLAFSAEILNGTEDMTLQVHYRHVPPGSAQADDWGSLTESAGSYALELAEGTYTFSFSVEQDGRTLASPQETRVVTWSCNKNPPTISAWLGAEALSDGGSVTTETQEPLLKVSAVDWKGKRVPLSGLTVWMDGEELVNYTGGGVKEYRLWLEKPDEGDEARHTVTVQAQDSAGQTAEESYEIVFIPIAEGERIGRATVRFDCTTVGLGWLDSGMEVEIRQGYPASYALLDCLAAYGWDCDYSGGIGGPEDRIGGFYMERLIGPDFSFANPKRFWPELWNCIENDMIGFNEDSMRPNGTLRDGDSLGEFDFTRGSGWLYEVNGYYPGKGMSDYYLQDGDVMTLRFTLAYGKDVGAGVGAEYGAFSSYCRVWVGDTAYPAEHPEEWYDTEETPATCTEEGKRTRTCPCCGDTQTEILPALGHNYEYEETEAADCVKAGSRHGVCAVCGEETDEEIPALGHTDEELSRVDPDCETEGSMTCRCSVCGEEHTEVLPSLGHSYENGICIRCGAADPDQNPEPPVQQDDLSGEPEPDDRKTEIEKEETT